MEFFSIFLPGFIVAFLFKNEILLVFPAETVSDKANSVSGVAYYFIASYIIGHFVYGTSGFILEALRPFRTYFAKRWEVDKALKIMHDRLLSIEGKEKSSQEKKTHKKEILWLQKWADSVIQIKHPELIITIRQYEADAKFFRSFVVVSLIGLVHSLIIMDKNFPFWYWIISGIISISLHFYWKFEAIKDASNVLVTMDSLGEFKIKTPETK
jgi:hypothetical protein